MPRRTKYLNYKKLKTTCSSQALEAIYHNGGYLLLLGKRKLLSFEISCD